MKTHEEINGRTPEEIKKELKLCTEDGCRQCPYQGYGYGGDCIVLLLTNALNLINQLEESIALMKIQMQGDCGVCKHKAHDDACLLCLLAIDKPMWEYEGLPQLPGKEERHEKPV